MELDVQKNPKIEIFFFSISKGIRRTAKKTDQKIFQKITFWKKTDFR